MPKSKKSKRKPITFINPYGPITKEKVEALPEHVKDSIGRLLYDFCISLALGEAESAVKMAA